MFREFARGSQSVSCVLKSAGEPNTRPGRNEVSRYPLRRSTMPLNSGSRGGGASLIVVANVPANAAAGAVTFPRPADRGLTIPHQRLGHPTDPGDQLPHAREDVAGLP